MRILVTGGAGFLGTSLCLKLASEGHEIVCVDNFLTSLQDNVDALRSASGIEVWEADVTARELPPHAALPDLDVVAHLACLASPDDYTRLPLETLATGAEGTKWALELAARSGARFLFASSSEVYGEPLHLPQAETDLGQVDPVGPRSAYDEAKRFGEALTTAYAARHHLDAVIARIFNTYGPRMRPDDGRVVPTFVRQALNGEALTIQGTGAHTRSFCFVDDLVRALTMLLASDLQGPINIGNPEEVTMSQLAHEVLAICESRSNLTYGAPRPADPSARRPDISRAVDSLGWQPEVSLRDGLARTVAWSREHWTLPDPDGTSGTSGS